MFHNMGRLLEEVIRGGSEGVVAGFQGHSKCIKVRNRTIDFGDGDTLKGDRVAVKEYCMGKVLEDANKDHLICKTEDFHIDDNVAITSMERYDGDLMQIMPPISCCPIGICAPTPLAIAVNKVKDIVTQQLEQQGIGISREDNDNKNWFFRQVDMSDNRTNTFVVDNIKYQVVRGDLSLSNVSDGFKEKMRQKFNNLPDRLSQNVNMRSEDMFNIFG